MNDIEKILYLTGVAADYFDVSGHHVCIDPGIRLAALKELGYDADDAHGIAQGIFDLDAKPWTSWLQPTHVMVLSQHEAIEIRVAECEIGQPLHYRVIFEEGDEISGTVNIAALQETGEYYIENERYVAYLLPLPGLAQGYHRLAVWNDQNRTCEARLIVSPAKSCDADHFGSRPWGLSVQLYTLKSDRNWGIGDFSDLAEFLRLAAEAGADVVALNPLHAPDMASESLASPYSPSDRRFLNPLYIDLEIEDDFCVEALFSEAEYAELSNRLAELRALTWVDYASVAAVKYSVFEHMYRRFRQHDIEPKTERGKAFAQFCEQRGTMLEDFAQFEATISPFEFAAASDSVFHQYLQWLADAQLSACQAVALASGMRIGLMRDLAVGAAREGAEVAANADLFCPQATVGAPPDAFAEHGQNWSLPALNPLRLKAHHYRYFINLMRTNMEHCGALRIDHIMGLLRLWWCLPNMRGGTYIYYPLDVLLAIVRLESHRAKCHVIGEDMGVVPDELREQLQSSGVLGTRLFYFDKTGEGHYRAPHDQNDQAILMLTNHDVPTLAGWWQAKDIQLNSEIHGADVSELESQRIARKAEKQQLIDWLQENRRLPEPWQQYSQADAMDIVLSSAVMATNAGGRAPMFLVQPEDLCLEIDPVNIPGTDREYPNWRRKLSISTQHMFSDRHIAAALAAINQQRTQ